MTSKILKGSTVKTSGAAPTAPHRDVGVSTEGGGVLDRRIISATERAQKIVDEAYAEATRIRVEAEALRAEVATVREEARKEGLAKGEAMGKTSVTEALLTLERRREEFYDTAEKEIVKLTIAIAEKVIGRIASERPEVVRDVVRQALERSLGDRIVVRLNPDDYKTITGEGYEFRDVIDRTKRIVFREDEAIQKGGCVVETEVGTIDAQIETQMEAIRKVLELQ